MFVKDLLKALFTMPPPAAQVTQQTTHKEELLPGEEKTYVRGVTFNKDVVNKIPKGNQKFYLVAEPSNKADSHAVQVCIYLDGALAKVGYLPAGEYKTEHFQKLALQEDAKGVLLVVAGRTRPFDGGVGVEVDLPKWQWLKARLKEV